MKKINLLLTTFIIALVFSTTSAHAATITVDTDVIPAIDGLCSFQEAIASSETDASTECTPGSGDDTINFALGLGDIILDNNVFAQITQNTIIQGATDGTVINMGSAVFVIDPAVNTDSIEINDIEMKDGTGFQTVVVNVVTDSPTDVVVTFDHVHIHDNDSSGITYEKNMITLEMQKSM